MKAIILFLSSFFLTLSSHAQVLGAQADLFELQARDTKGKTQNQIFRESIIDYEKFLEVDVNSRLNSPYSVIDANKPKNITKAHAEILLVHAMNNPVVKFHSMQKYDPTGTLGFCFGRAMFVNIYLSMTKFNRANIKKAFLIGPMHRGQWVWHVTTIVQSKDSLGRETWLAIDPVAGKVMDVKAWYTSMIEDSDDGKLRLYITEAGKFMAWPSRYDETYNSVSEYNGYFNDMMKWFSEYTL